MGDYAGMIFRNPSDYAPHAYAWPDASTEGTITIQLLTEAGVNTEDPVIAEKLGLIANMPDMMEALNRNPDAGPEEVLSNVMNGINAFVGEAEQFDDITMLCMKYNGPAKKNTL